LVFYEKYFDKINIEKVTTTISKFLKELYCIPINKDNVQKARNKMKKSFNSDMLTIKKYFGNENIDKINAFENEYLDYLNNFDDFHYTHGDFWQENMIISEDYQDIVGVVDFDNFGLGDIAKDYASLLDFGFDFINILLDKTKDIIQDKENFIKRIKLFKLIFIRK
jgi:aminoglycoside phosphotransferase